MSKARKCDRCHNFYEPYPQAIVVCVSHEYLDLCPACYKKLRSWIHEYEFFDSVCEETEDVPETE